MSSYFQGTALAITQGMSRVEPNKNDDNKRESRKRNEEQPPLDRTPGKAEGDEETVDEALRNQRDENSD